MNRFFSIAALIAFCLAPALTPRPCAQTIALDTLAIRILLTENGHATTPISQVATIGVSGRVNKLDLSGLSLIKLTGEVGSITDLRTLILSNNLLDSIPPELWTLDLLTVLDLGGNKLNKLDTGVGNLVNLVALGLHKTGLSVLPEQVFRCKQLEQLILSGNALTAISENAPSLGFLKFLDLSANQLTAVPYTFGAFDLIDSVDLSSNLIDSLPALITSMNPAAKVHLADNRLCNLTPALKTWADGKDTSWAATQTCGAAIRPVAGYRGRAGLSAWREAGSLYLSWPGRGNLQGTVDLLVRDVRGHVLASRSLAGAVKSWSLTGLTAVGHGPLYVELRSSGKLLDDAWVAPGW